MAMNADELPIRTPEGFARRQQVEGFRRFFVASEGRHAREAAERGELRLYSAWAVALGELDRWNKAMAATALPTETSGVAEIDEPRGAQLDRAHGDDRAVVERRWQRFVVGAAGTPAAAVSVGAAGAAEVAAGEGAGRAGRRRRA